MNKPIDIHYFDSSRSHNVIMDCYNTIDDKLPNGDSFFRKIIAQTTHSDIEYRIATMLKQTPYDHIVTFYTITQSYIDMELIIPANEYNLSDLDRSLMIQHLSKAKEYLHSIGIVYLDWKIDNCGIDKHGRFKLYDFDVSGIIDLQTNQWILEAPPNMWAYRYANKNGIYDPIEMDDFLFNYFVKTI